MSLIEQTPSQLAQLRLELADRYAKAGEMKVKLLRIRAEYFRDFRADHKSDASLERAFECTADGLNLMELGQKMKNIEHKLSAIRTLLEVKNNEMRNQY